MSYKIATIINYCTYDYRFIGRLIGEVKKFSDQIVIPFCDRFFDGSPEDKGLLEKTIEENPAANFIQFQYEKINPPWPGHPLWKRVPKSFGLRPLYGTQFLACKARLIGHKAILPDTDYVLFLDSDELIDGDDFARWLEAGEYRNFGALAFLCYLYFRETKYRAEKLGHYALLLKNGVVPEKNFFSYEERWSLYKNASGQKKIDTVGLDGLPMIHHYSWARPKDEMLKKVRSWGHNLDRDWAKLVLDEFSHDFNGTDFIWGYRYKTVEPFFDPRD